MKSLIPFLTVCIWGSLYVAGRFVMPEIPALLLLFFRFGLSSVLLLLVARMKSLGHIEKKDFPEIFFVGFFGYFLSNAALLLGIEYAGASVSSLINAMNPAFISLFAVLFLKEQLSGRALLSIGITILGAFFIIGSPGKDITGFGIGCCLFSMLLWSYVTIHIKKLTAKYPPLLVTGTGMGIAAVLSLPTALIFLKLTKTSVTFRSSMILPLFYICIICTAISHVAWNYALSVTNASTCSSFYPLQPLSSMILGVLLLKEKFSKGFLLGAALILLAMLYRSLAPAIVLRKNIPETWHS